MMKLTTQLKKEKYKKFNVKFTKYHGALKGHTTGYVCNSKGRSVLTQMGKSKKQVLKKIKTWVNKKCCK